MNALVDLIERECIAVQDACDTREAALDYGGYGCHAPARVKDHRAYWTSPPAEQSPRCAWWIDRIKAGWRPNRRIRALGYDDSAEFFGVYIWEWLNVLSPLLDEVAR